MNRMYLVFPLLLACAGRAPTTESPVAAPDPAPEEPALPSADEDTYPTETGPITVDFRHHGTLRLEHEGRSIWIDPWSPADLSGPKADLLLITDIHPDHLDLDAIEAVRKEGSVLVGPPAVGEQIDLDYTLANHESERILGIEITATPMYNHVRGPEPGVLYHDKGRGNGYLLEIAGARVYIAGDTACIDEMKALTEIDLAFIPMNLPYTMTPTEAGECIEAFRPRVVYPYHYRGADLSTLQDQLQDAPDIQLRVRDWYREAPAP